ncbi:MAG: arginine--tRNA ligase [Caldilineaceae bacterium]
MLQDEIQQVIADAITAAQADESLAAFEIPAIEIMRPKQADHGDYSTNIALVTASEIKKQTGAKSNPRQIAQAIVDHMQVSPNGDGGLIESVDLAGPGFINLRLSHAYLTAQVRLINSLGDDYGRSNVGGGQKAMVEYISANPTGPLTVGHGRNAVLGDTFATLLDWIGYDVTREYYFNNAGRQMRVLGQSVRARYEELLTDPAVTAALELDEEQRALLQQHVANYRTKQIDAGDGKMMEAPASFPDDGYQGEYIYDIAQSLIDAESVSLLAKEELHPFQLAAEKAIFADIDRTIQRLGIKMDLYFNEHSLYENENVWEVLNALQRPRF